MTREKISLTPSPRWQAVPLWRAVRQPSREATARQAVTANSSDSFLQEATKLTERDLGGRCAVSANVRIPHSPSILDDFTGGNEGNGEDE